MADGGRTQRTRRAEISETLVERLEAIASPSRLQLLDSLQEPAAVSDIHLEASDEQGNGDRRITSQGVRHHLNKLLDAGFVEVRRSETEGKRVNEYVTNTQRLYELGEVLGSMPLSLAAPSEELGAPPTWAPSPSGVPSLTVVHGAEIGRSFRLNGEPNFSDRGWVIGQAPDVDVRLDWDAGVGRQAGEIERDKGSFRVIDLRATPRRVSVNGQALERGASKTISDGDLVGVGRSLLWFRE